MTGTAHIDTFARDRLPPTHSWPEMRFTLDSLQYPPRLNCAAELLDRHVREGRGDRRCIIDDRTAWSYAQLQRASNRIARVLVDDLGVVPGNRILIRGHNSAMFAACWFACMKTGAIAVSTMPLYRSTELRIIADRAQVQYALCEADLATELRSATDDRAAFATVLWGNGDLEERMERKAGDFDNVDTAADDVAIIAFTSGTTGRPKAAMHFHRDVLAVCDSYGKYVLEARADELFTGSPPIAFTFGLGGLLLFPLRIGAATLLLQRASPQTLLAAIQKHRVNVLFTAPVAYRGMLEHIATFDVSSLRICVSAGETLPAAVWNAWHQRTGRNILDGIGSTEMLHIFIGSPYRDAIPGCTGRAVPGYVAEIHDDAGVVLPLNTVGRLAVKGPTGCRYLDDERQSTYVAGGWNYPGDAYRQDEQGRFWYVARTDDMIVASGYNISGPEVELTLMEHIDVAECAVIGKPDPARQTNIVKAYVVLRDGADGSFDKVAELQAFVRERIAAFKSPREIEFVSELPRTETGKLQRFRLRERA